MSKTFAQLNAFLIRNFYKIIKTQLFFIEEYVEINCRCGSRDPACINIDIPANDSQRVIEGKIYLPVIRSQPVPNKKCTIIRIVRVV